MEKGRLRPQVGVDVVSHASLSIISKILCGAPAPAGGGGGFGEGGESGVHRPGTDPKQLNRIHKPSEKTLGAAASAAAFLVNVPLTKPTLAAFGWHAPAGGRSAPTWRRVCAPKGKLPAHVGPLIKTQRGRLAIPLALSIPIPNPTGAAEARAVILRSSDCRRRSPLSSTQPTHTHTHHIHSGARCQSPAVRPTRPLGLLACKAHGLQGHRHHASGRPQHGQALGGTRYVPQDGLGWPAHEEEEEEEKKTGAPPPMQGGSPLLSELHTHKASHAT
jgi:hypothetical protein